MKKIALILCSLLVCSVITAQTLLTINDKEISKQEFEYYYKKNNHIDSDSLSPKDYLEMFINFKLKVEEAYLLKYDTVASFEEEFNTYRAPLAAGHLTDSAKIKELEEEAYNYLLKDIEVSHILFRVENPEDTTLAYEKAIAAKKRAKKMDFNKLAEEVSEDPSVVVNKGKLGWVTGMTMVYPFEKAAFELKKGKVSDPVRTAYGYHLIKVHNTRPTRGEILVAHIFKRKPEDADSSQIDAIRKEMHRIHSVLTNGGEFEDLVKAHSEDNNTLKGGVIPWIVTGKTNEIFENAAFALKYPEDISPVIEAPYGFHIIQLKEKLAKADYDRWIPQIKTRIRMDERALIIRKSFINKTRKEYNLTSQTDSEVLEYANNNLEKKYPEFGLLMQEYRDGILLFNISKDQVWDKASKDEAKLKEIYDNGNFDKPYNKVRGIVISKYQDELEQEWIKELREKYTVTVNEDVLNTIK